MPSSSPPPSPSRRRGSIHRLHSRVNASGRPYLPTTTRQHLGGTSIPSRNRRAGAESGGERASKRAPAATAVRVPTLSRRRTHGRARVLDRLRLLIGFRGLIKSQGGRKKREKEKANGDDDDDGDGDARSRVRRRDDDGGGDDGERSPFPCVRENSRELTRSPTYDTRCRKAAVS